MYDTPPLIVDPAAIQAWLAQPAGEHPDETRTEHLGVDDELTAPGMGDFLGTIDDILAAEPDGLHRRADLTRVELWPVHDGEGGALITVDLADGVRLCTLHQDVKAFARRGQHGIPAVLAALAHIANQVSLLLDTYHAANPCHGIAAPTGSAAVTAGRVTVAELIERLRGCPPHLQVWVADPHTVEGYAPLDGTVHPGSDPAPPAADPGSFVVLGAAR
ncbi:hypothetical protein [Dactylosporangium sp. CA-092794]|uniref:hypothetical protein n=1 Tax=Dactylosporangium sp. CA-092794 TaxID=3239929 RepID=UPI003D906651